MMNADNNMYGCTSTCQIHSNWSCEEDESQLSTCYPIVEVKSMSSRRRLDDDEDEEIAVCSSDEAADPSSVCCGDGYYDAGEECDFGLDLNGDSYGCTSECTIDTTGTFSTWNIDCSTLKNTISGDSNYRQQICTAHGTCGNGNRDGTEQCDDFNIISGDGCSSSCEVETGFTCVGGSSKAYQRDYCFKCGNGKREYPEVCDDGNTVAKDGCEANCLTTTYGYLCTGGSVSSSDTCEITCGDGVIGLGEVCDDGNLIDGDG